MSHLGGQSICGPLLVLVLGALAVCFFMSLCAKEPGNGVRMSLVWISQSLLPTAFLGHMEPSSLAVLPCEKLAARSWIQEAALGQPLGQPILLLIAGNHLLGDDGGGEKPRRAVGGAGHLWSGALGDLERPHPGISYREGRRWQVPPFSTSPTRGS